MKEYNKLVRDNIIEIIKSNGETPIYKTLNEKEYYEYLLLKDKEELEELKQATTKEEIKEELADKLEVLIALIEYNNSTLEEITEIANIKRNKKGAFKKRLLLEKTL